MGLRHRASRVIDLHKLVEELAGLRARVSTDESRSRHGDAVARAELQNEFTEWFGRFGVRNRLEFGLKFRLGLRFSNFGVLCNRNRLNDRRVSLAVGSAAESDSPSDESTLSAEYVG